MATELTEIDLDLITRMRVSVPPKKAGRMEIVQFVVPPGGEREDYYGPRFPEPGQYTKLVENVSGHEDVVWMSDTAARVSRATFPPLAALLTRPASACSSTAWVWAVWQSWHAASITSSWSSSLSKTHE